MKIKLNEDSTRATVWVYDTIGEDFFGGVSSKTFADELQPLADLPIEVRINSPGGDAFAGVTMHSLLRDRKPDTTVVIDGLAASAASIVAMGGDTIEMRAGAMIMIHEPSVFTFGNAKELRSQADILEQVNDSIVSIYTRRTGASQSEIRTLLADETWMTAEDAIANGFADSTEDMPAVAAWIDPAFAKAMKFRNVPEWYLSMATAVGAFESINMKRLDWMRKQADLTRSRLLLT